MSVLRLRSWASSIIKTLMPYQKDGSMACVITCCSVMNSIRSPLEWALPPDIKIYFFLKCNANKIFFNKRKKLILIEYIYYLCQKSCTYWVAHCRACMDVVTALVLFGHALCNWNGSNDTGLCANDFLRELSQFITEYLRDLRRFPGTCLRNTDQHTLVKKSTDDFITFIVNWQFDIPGCGFSQWVYILILIACDLLRLDLRLLNITFTVIAGWCHLFISHC